MAGNKVNAKAKGRDDKSKGGKSTPSEEVEDEDFSLLRKPVHTSVTSFGQARKIFDLATEELKGLLSEECDLLYECKVCRNLFRSLANFISHKRVYCKEKFNTTVHGHFIKSSSTLTELQKIKRMEKGYQEWLKEYREFEAMETDEFDERVPLSKDLTAVIEKLSNNKGVNNNNEPQVTLQRIPNSTVAMFQNFDADEDTENMSSQVNELDTILSRNVAVLQKDGQFSIQSGGPNDSNVIQISDDEDIEDLKCKKCDMQFSTQKTLKFHMKYKHVDTRLVYPCPECFEVFCTSWSVYRHLYKVHRKTAAQIRRLRESIQAKAFKMNNPPAFYEKRKNTMKTATVQKITEEERIDQENQAWMEGMECDGELPRCGGCGRGFERRAALAAHTHTCPPRTRALRRADTKRIEIQIRKDYNKGPPPTVLTAKLAELTETKTTKDKVRDEKEEPDTKEKEKKKAEEPPVVEDIKNDDENSIDSLSQPSNEEINVESPEQEPKPSVPETVKLDRVIRLPFAQDAEKSNLIALRQRVIGDIQLDKLLCKKCDTKCDNIQELYDHVAKHYKWVRYACKLCNFKHYHFDKLPEHVKIVHKLKGDKDFYFSTVRAIDGQKAEELAEPVEDNTENNETSPNSRRPSRCSSDSSRVSDDSSSSSTRVEGARKRKMQKPAAKGIGKRRKSMFKGNKDEEDQEKTDSPTTVKAFEENSSDMDDSYDKIDKKQVEETTASVASRRPVRRRTKPKNADFEYDLSNLLKLEAQGYRESQTVTTKPSQTKKKPQLDPGQNIDILNKECCGALATLSRKAVERFKAVAKTTFMPYIQKEKIPSNIFVRPMVPKILARGDKVSPKKDNVSEDKKDTPSKTDESVDVEVPDVPPVKPSNNTEDTNTDQSDTSKTPAVNDNDDQSNVSKSLINPIKTKPIPSVVPLKIRRQLDVMKNPIINKNISDFTKAGMKTKILVIKPIKRKNDGPRSLNTPLKFQTIKLKDTNKSEDKSSDQVVVVKVPKMDCITRTLPDDKSQVTPDKSTNSDNKSLLANDDISDMEKSELNESIAEPVLVSEKLSSEKSTIENPSEKSTSSDKSSNLSEKSSIVTNKEKVGDSIVITEISSPTNDESALVVITEKSTEIVAKNQSASENDEFVNEETNGDVESTKTGDNCS